MVSYWLKEQEKDQFELKITDILGNDIPLTELDNKTVIRGWRKVTFKFVAPGSVINILFNNNPNSLPAGNPYCYLDDFRIHPVRSSFVSYVYDYNNYRMMAVLDDNNFASLFEYDQEGALVRKKIETLRGIMTVQESRNSLRRN